MSASVTGPYLTAAAVLGYRWYKVGQVPPPIRLVGLTAVMAGCGLIADANSRLGVTLAWGFVVAAAIGPGVTGSVVPVTWTTLVLGAPDTNVSSAPSISTGNKQVQAGTTAKLNRLPTPLG